MKNALFLQHEAVIFLLKHTYCNSFFVLIAVEGGGDEVSPQSFSSRECVFTLTIFALFCTLLHLSPLISLAEAFTPLTACKHGAPITIVPFNSW